MTWLPISLKNAAKCDKWYQLQNHSITESLNAKGAWEKLFKSHPRACRTSSVSNNKNPKEEGGTKKRDGGRNPLYLSLSLPIRAWVVEAQRWMKKKESGVAGERGVLPLYLSLLLFLFLRFAPVFARGKKENTRGGGFSFFSYFSFSRGRGTKPEKKQQKTAMFFTHFFFRTSFTDLSAAGLPAKLKHITQRRKRKQP